jgi:hypothetical protein
MNGDWLWDLLCLALGLVVGFGTGWFSYRGRQIAKRQLAEEGHLVLEKRQNALQIEQAKISERNRMLEENCQLLQSELAQERQFNISLHAELSRERAGRNHMEQKVEQQKNDHVQLQERLSQEFKNLVEQVLEEKSRSLTDLNTSNLNVLLQPISEKLQDFKQKLEEQHYRETRELIVLHNKLANLESGRWPHQNGASVPAPSPAPSPVAGPPPAQEEAHSSDHDELLQYIPPSLDPDPATEEESQESLDAQVVKSESLLESDGFHTFSPKQQVEIDNFFKRTLGRAQRKKPAA